MTSLTGLGLAPLAFYGGPTQTMALLSGSAAIGKGVAVSSITTDQRGFPLDKPIDIGAFQTNPLVVNTALDGTGSPSGDLSLRQAVNLVDVLGAAETISFSRSVFATAQTITLTQGELILSGTGGTQTITGSQAGVTISGHGSGVFQVNTGVTAALSGLTITGGSSTFGGGVFNQGTATLTNCTISGNSAEFGGGVDNSLSSTATLTNCTISRNSGGGVDDSLFSKATLINCTISGNSGFGMENYGTATLTNCTISGNSDGGGVDNQVTATLTNTIVAGNTGSSSAASDIIGNRTVTGSHDLIGTGGSGGLTKGQNGNIVLTSLTGLGLAVLGKYGGPTQTIALLPGSHALGAGVIADYPGTTTPITTDQRGEPLDTPKPDIGAFQSQGFELTPVAASTPQFATTGTAFTNPLAVTVAAKNSVEPVAGGVLTFAAPASGASAKLSTTTATIGSKGVASVTATANATVGSYTVTASAGSGNATAHFALTNTSSSLIASKTSLSSSLNPSVYGQAITLTATVTPKSGSGTPTGSVTFYDGSTALGTATLASGKASLSTTVLPAGPQSVFAVYRGDSKYAPGDSPVLTQTVNRDSTTTTVTSSTNPSVLGQKVTFTATVKAVAPGSGTPTGTVTFYNGSTVLGTGSLSGGIGTFTTSSLSVGTHSIKAVYSGNSDCQISTSAVLTQVVNESAGSSPAVAVGPSVVDQVLAVVQNQSSQEVLIGDLAFEQLSSMKPWRK